jgi:hypothetical protein
LKTILLDGRKGEAKASGEKNLHALGGVCCRCTLIQSRQEARNTGKKCRTDLKKKVEINWANKAKIGK